MSARRRVVASLLVLAVLAAALAWGGRHLVLERFEALEDREARQNVERALTALVDELTDLGAAVEDYAAWDATYDFMRTRDPEYVRSSLPQAVLPTFHIHYLALLDEAGAVVYGKAMNLDSHADEPLSPELADELIEAVRRASEPGQVRTEGIARTSHGPVLLAWRPIVRNDGSGQARGTLVMAYRFDGWLDEKLTRYTRLTMSWRSHDDPDMPGDFAWARDHLSSAMPVLARARSDDVFSAYALVRDCGGDPALVVRVDTYRRLHAEGGFSARLLAGSLGLLFVVAAALAAATARGASS